MSHYLFLLHPEGLDMAAMAADDKQLLFDKFVSWSESLKERGHLRGVESLMDMGGRTVRKKDGALVVDGPFAEMREMVTGLFIVEVSDEDEALALAKECPLVALGGAIEVRVVAPFPVRP